MDVEPFSLARRPITAETLFTSVEAAGAALLLDIAKGFQTDFIPAPREDSCRDHFAPILIKIP